MQYKLYGNINNIICNNSVNLNNSVLDLSKKDINVLSTFFSDKSISVSDSNNVFGINDIKFNNVLIKPSYKVLDSNETYSFDVKKSYVITVDKEVMDDINKFYSMFIPIDNTVESSSVIFDGNDIFQTNNEVEESKGDVDKEVILDNGNSLDSLVEDNKSQIIFRADNETNLKEVFDNVEPSVVVSNSNDSSNNEIISSNDSNKTTTSTSSSSGWLILICVLAGIALTVMGVFIAISILRG